MTQLNEPVASDNAMTQMPPPRPQADPAHRQSTDHLPTSFMQAEASATVSSGPPVTNGLAVAALVLGIASIPFCWWGIATLAMVVLAIVFGSIGIHRANAGAPKKSLAVAGLCCGIVGLFAYLIVGIMSLGIGLFI
jgi:hypothetical protein